MKHYLTLLCLACCTVVQAQETSSLAVAIPADTSAINLQSFAQQVVANETSNFKKAKTLLNWLSTNLQWTATDYKSRTVKEIIVRKGGNCFELAKVYMALIKELGIQYRPIAEINLHVINDRRQQTAEEKVKNVGFRMSVFGRQHNDHRWVEIYDTETDRWVPADPTMNIIGFDQWLKARAWFGERHTINDQFSNDMIVPFAIFVADKNNGSLMVENRTSQYLIKELDALYHYRLSKLPSWKQWIAQLEAMQEHAKLAFANQENLHLYARQIDQLAHTYAQLKQEYLAAVK